MKRLRKRRRAWEQLLLLRYGDDLLRSELGRWLLDTRMRACGFRTLAAATSEQTATPSAGRINRLLREIGGDRRYLEIGVQHGLTIEGVSADLAVGVDPAHSVNIARLPRHIRMHTVPSDEFFAARAGGSSSQEFDLVLVDGLHRFLQAYRDVLNAFRVLNPRGIVVVDDTVPSNEYAALEDRGVAKRLHQEHGLVPWEWMGDVFKAVLLIVRAHPAVRVATIVDEGMRPQTLMWRTREFLPSDIGSASLQHIASVQRLTYGAVFGAGIPPEFRAMSLEEAIREYQQDVRR